MTFVIVGASSGLGRALAKVFAAAGHDLVIVSSDNRDLVALASDLTIRNGVRVVSIEADLGRQSDCAKQIFTAANELGDLQGLLFPVGSNSAEDNINVSSEEAVRLIRINLLSIISIIEKCMPILRSRSKGVIVGFGSVAAARGRGANIVYAAAKRALASYFESLRHATADSDITVQFYVLGYLETNLSFGVPTLLPKADVEKLGKKVLDNLDKDFGAVFYPGYWRCLYVIVRLLPWSLFKHLKF